MRATLRIGMVCALVALTFGGVGARAAGEAWLLAPSPSGAFSVETPCTEAEIAKLRAAPDDLIPNVKLIPNSRVVCFRNNLMMMAGEVLVPGYPADAKPMFDEFVALMPTGKTVAGKPTLTMINGHRAVTNRETKGDVLAQTGVIEIDRGRVMMLVAGTMENSGISLEDQAATVDRFYASTKVTAK